MLGPDDGGLSEKSVANASFNVSELLDGLLFGEAVQEQIDIGSRAEFLVVKLAKSALGAIILFWDGKQTVDDSRPRCDDIAPNDRGKKKKKGHSSAC